MEFSHISPMHCIISASQTGLDLFVPSYSPLFITLYHIFSSCSPFPLRTTLSITSLFFLYVFCVGFIIKNKIIICLICIVMARYCVLQPASDCFSCYDWFRTPFPIIEPMVYLQKKLGYRYRSCTVAKILPTFPSFCNPPGSWFLHNRVTP